MPRIDRNGHLPGAGPVSALITGASSGLGAALAEALARPGATLHLGGRDTARLDTVAATCRRLGAEVHAHAIELIDRDATASWITQAGRIDLVIANAGISGGVGRDGIEPAAQTRAIFDTNLAGALNTILPALEALRAQAPGPDGLRGSIAAIASISAFLPAPVAPSYAASKAALDSWVVAQAGAWARQGVRLCSVCPGFIRSPMTARNRFPMPGLMDADRAARLVLAGLASGRRRVVFPRWLAAAGRAVDLLPPQWQERVTRKGSK